MLYVDYTVPVEEVREELLRILKSTDLWDGETWSLQVTDVAKDAVQLRALMSAADPGRAWDLRCYVRERLLGFLQERHADHLPKTRTEILAAAPQPAPA
jgi:hypothetical protein